jgi:photosystem II stability/assembly factor-like uncharacterized protein
MKFSTALCFLFISTSSFAQWTVVSNKGDGHLFFLNDTLGWGLGQKTIDGGHNWDTMKINVDHVYFTDAKNGHAITNTNTGPPTYYRSADGGNSWTDASVGFSGRYGGYLLDFPSKNVGFAFSGPVLHKTSNAGLDWDTTFYNPDFQIRYYDFIDDNNGFMACSHGFVGDIYLFRTSNGGTSWDSSIINFSSTLPYWAIVKALNTKELVAMITDYGKSEVLYSGDRGKTWVQRFKSDSMKLSSMDFPNRDTGYIVGSNYKIGADSGLVLRSTNRSLTWQILKSNYSRFLFYVDFITGTKGWALGQFREIIYTDNGGGAFTTSGLPQYAPRETKVFPNPSNGHLRIDFETRQNNAEVVIYNITGEIVMKRKVQRNIQDFFEFDVPSGLYFVQLLMDNGKEKTVKIIQK